MKTRTGPQSDPQHEEPSRIDSMMHKMFRVPKLSVAGSHVTVGPSWSVCRRSNSSPKKSPAPLLWILFGLLAAGGMLLEMRTSAVQSWMLSYIAGRMTYSVEPGPSTRIDFPKEGPFDEVRGYTRIPDFEERLKNSSFRVVEQARFPSLTSDLNPGGFRQSEAGKLNGAKL